MNLNGVEDDGFVVVRRRTNGRRRVTRISITEAGLPDVALDKETAIRRIHAAREDFEASDYYKSFMITLKEGVASLSKRPVVEILCFGLGHVGECMVSRYQLALVLCLREHYRVNCLLHDPAFYTDECRVLKTLGFDLIEENEEGKHQLRTDGITIVYMPHCPKQLTNNFLWKNWGTSLTNCVLVSNSFTAMIESRPQRLLDETVPPHILNIFSYTQEFSLVNSFKYHDIFNDLSVHIFPQSILSLITDNFWSNRGDEPSYDADDVEIITKSVAERLKIDSH